MSENNNTFNDFNLLAANLRNRLEENKQYFKEILNNLMENYRFNPELFPEERI